MWATVAVGQQGRGAPSSRCKHAASAVGSASGATIYLLGGRSANLPLKDLWKYDPGSNRWEEVRCRGVRPPCLQEHTMVAWKNFLYVFGGEVGFASTGETPLWILDLGSGTWRKHQLPARGGGGDQPSGRRGHSAVVFNGAMHVYGGYQDLRGSSSELWSFSFETERWHLTFLTSQVEQPPARHGHSAVLHDGAMWVYGGLTDLQERSDFWKWDFASRQWIRLKAQRGGPGEMHAHSAVKAMSYMYLYGGERAGVLLDELWRYHFATETWEKIQVEGVSPPPRCQHVAIADPCAGWQETHIAWEERAPLKEIPDPKPHQPPKSISMCFGQNNDRRPFKFRVHPVSRLCSKNTTSDEDDDDPEYVASYSTQIAQANISKSLREKLSTCRLVRSISGGNYNIMHAGARCEELERLVEESTPQHARILKSHSSDAVLTESESSTPRHQPPDIISVSNPRWDETRVAHVLKSSSRDTDEETLEELVPMLIDLDSPAPRRGERRRSRGRQSANSRPKSTGSEIAGLPYARSSGYHSFTEEELGKDYHKEFAGSLNTSLLSHSPRSDHSDLQSDNVELKTLVGERARSWDRSVQRRVHRQENRTPKDSSPGRRWTAAAVAARGRIEHRNWQLCFYVLGGKEQGAPGVYRQPISLWKLYM